MTPISSEQTRQNSRVSILSDRLVERLINAPHGATELHYLLSHILISLSTPSAFFLFKNEETDEDGGRTRQRLIFSSLMDAKYKNTFLQSHPEIFDIPSGQSIEKFNNFDAINGKVNGLQVYLDVQGKFSKPPKGLRVKKSKVGSVGSYWATIFDALSIIVFDIHFHSPVGKDGVSSEGVYFLPRPSAELSTLFKRFENEIARRLDTYGVGVNTIISPLINNSKWQGQFGVDKTLLSENRDGNPSSKEEIAHNERQSCKVAINRIKWLIDAEYQKLVGSPILCPYGKVPANIAFFLKVFDRNEYRSGGDSDSSQDLSDDNSYSFDARWIIPAAQKGHLITCLTGLYEHYIVDGEIDEGRLKIARENNKWRLRYDTVDFGDESLRTTYRPPVESNVFIFNGAKFPEIDDLFWHALRDGVDQEWENIFSVLESPLMKNDRSIIDPVLCSGLPHWRYAPYKHIGGTVFSNEAIDLTDLSEDQQIRRVYKHYLMAILAPETEGEIAAFMTAIRAGGSPWIGLAKFENLPKDDRKRFESGLSPLGTTLEERSTDFYYSITRKLESNLRREGKRLYLNLVASIFLAAVERASELIGEENIMQLVESHAFEEYVIQPMNAHLRGLTRVFPWPLVKFKAGGASHYDDLYDGVIPVSSRIKLQPETPLWLVTEGLPKSFFELGKKDFWPIVSLDLDYRALGEVREPCLHHNEFHHNFDTTRYYIRPKEVLVAVVEGFGHAILNPG